MGADVDPKDFRGFKRSLGCGTTVFTAPRDPDLGFDLEIHIRVFLLFPVPVGLALFVWLFELFAF